METGVCWDREPNQVEPGTKNQESCGTQALLVPLVGWAGAHSKHARSERFQDQLSGRLCTHNAFPQAWQIGLIQLPTAERLNNQAQKYPSISARFPLPMGLGLFPSALSFGRCGQAASQ